MTVSLARANPLIGLTEDEYKDFARALVSYVALHATVDQTSYFMSLVRDYTGEIAGKVAVGRGAGRDLASVLATRGRTGAADTMLGTAFKSSRSH